MLSYYKNHHISRLLTSALERLPYYKYHHIKQHNVIKRYIKKITK